MLSGRVKWFNDTKGFGYIVRENRSSKSSAAGEVEDLFVHQSSIISKGFKTLTAGERVSFEISEERGRQAVNVHREGSH